MLLFSAWNLQAQEAIIGYSDLFHFNTKYRISGIISDSETGLPIQGAIVSTLNYESLPSSADGEYYLLLPVGYGYQLTISAKNYETVYKSNINITHSEPVSIVNVSLTSLPSEAVLTTMHPNPNPEISKVQLGGSIHRYYKIVNHINENPLPHIPLEVSGLSQSFTSNNEGIVEIIIHSNKIGTGQPGDQKTFSIIAINNEELAEPIHFVCKIEELEHGKYWESNNWIDGSYIVFSGGKDYSGRMSFFENNHQNDHPDFLSVNRENRARGGLTFGAGVGLDVSLGNIDIGGYGSAGVGVVAAGITGDGYTIEYGDMSTSESLTFSYLMLDAFLGSLDSPLRHVKTVFQVLLYLYSGQDVFDNSAQFTTTGFNVSAGADVSAIVGIDGLSFSNGLKLGTSGSGSASAQAFRTYTKNIQENSKAFDVGVSYEYSSQELNSVLALVSPWVMLFDFIIPNINNRIATTLSVEKDFNDNIIRTEVSFSSRNGSNEEKIIFTIENDHLGLLFNQYPEFKKLIDLSISSYLFIDYYTAFQFISGLFEFVYKQQELENAIEANYEKQIKYFQTDNVFSIDLNVLVASFGTGATIEEGRYKTKEKGKLLNKNVFITESYDSYIPDIYEDLPIRRILTLSSILSIIDNFVFTSDILSLWPFKDNIFYVGDTGSYLTYEPEAFPADLDSITCASWSWYGDSPGTRKNDIVDDFSRAIYQKNRKETEEQYGMTFGIGGFYQFEPYDLKLLDTIYLTISYDQDEIKGFDESDLAMYYEDKDENTWVFIGGEIDALNKTVTAPIGHLSNFTLAPSLPYGTINLNASPDSINADGISKALITSDTIFNNNMTPVSDGEMFTINISHGEILTNDVNPDMEGIQIMAQDHRIQFEIVSGNIGAVATISTHSINGSASGILEVLYVDTIPPSTPVLVSALPSNQMVQLQWLQNPELDLAGYKIYYDTDTVPPLNGIHTVYGQPSPIVLGVDTLRNVVGLLNDSTYYFAVSAYDNSGNESELSGFISTTPSSCPVPSGLDYSNLTSTSISISWIIGMEAELWELLYGSLGFDTETEGILISDISEVPYVLTGLSSGTEYDVYVRSICGENVSDWAGPVSFMTIPTYQITLTANPPEGGIVEGEGVYESGEQVSINAIPAEGYHFTGWTEDGDVVMDGDQPAGEDYTFTAEQDRVLVANFAINIYTIDAAPNDEDFGTVSGAGNYEHFATVELIATPAEGYHFTSWTEDGQVVMDGDEPVGVVYTFIAEQDRNLMANFAINTYTLLYAAGENGSLDGDLAQTVEHGGNGTPVEAIPDEGYHFTQWSDGLTDNPRMDTNVTANLEVEAEFSINVYTITAVPNNEDFGTVAGGGSYEHFATVELVATPAEGYHFIGWTEDGDVVMEGDQPAGVVYTFIAEQDRNLMANFAINTYTLLYAAGENGSIEGDLEQTVEHGGDGTPVEAIPDEGYHFTGWSDGVTDNPRTDTNVTADLEVEAQFAINVYTITAVPNDEDFGTVTGGGSYEHFATVELIATPAEGYNFTGWTEDGDVVMEGDQPAGEVYTFTAEQNRALVANFVINTYTLFYAAGPGGSLVGDTEQTVEHGAEGTPVEAIPDEGYHFTGWSDGVTDNPRTDTDITANLEVEAQFAINVYTITAVPNDEDFGTVTGGGSYEHFATVELIATPTEGYHFTGWTEDGDVVMEGDQPAGEVYTFTAEQDRALVARFAINTYTLLYAAGPGGSLVGDTEQTVEYGADGTSVEAISDEGYYFSIWSDGVTDNPRTDTNVTADLEVEAQFAINVYTITAVPNDEDFGTVTGGGSYEHFEEVTLTAIPETVYHFVEWTEDGQVVMDGDEPAGAVYTFTAEEDRDLVANFILSSFTVTFIIENEHGETITDAVVTLDQTENPPGDYVFEDVEPGDYSYTVAAQDYFDASGEVEVIDQDIAVTVVMEVDDTGIAEAEIPEINIFPNPARNTLHVESNMIISQIQVLDMLGQRVMTQTVNDIHHELNVSGLKDGLYFIQVFTERGVKTLRVQVFK